jgi:hypothetical protein
LLPAIEAALRTNPVHQDLVSAIAARHQVGHGHFHVRGTPSPGAGLGSIEFGYCHGPSLKKIS